MKSDWKVRNYMDISLERLFYSRLREIEDDLLSFLNMLNAFATSD